MSDRLKRCTAQLIAGSVRLGVLLAVLWGGLLSGAPAQAQLASAPWPKFGQDVRNTGQSPSGGAGVAWQSTIGRAGTGPSIAADGTIYIGASNTFGEDSLYAISPSTGSVEWFFAPSDFRARSVQPLVAGDGTVYVGGRSSDGGLLYAVNPDGTEKWQFFDSDEIRTAPLLSADGTVFVITGDFSTGSRLYALSPSSGQPLWSVDVDYSSASPTISGGGTIYIGGNDGRIYTVDASTQLADTLDTAVSGSIEGIAIGGGGVLYVSSGGNQLTAINPDNDTQLWSSSVDLFSITPPSVGPGGRVFVGAGGEVDGAIYAFDQSGNELWSTFTDGRIDTPPTVGSNGRVYVGVNNFPDTEVLALNASDGSAAWSVVTGGNISNPFAIASDGTVYAGTGNGLFSITDPELSLTPGTLSFDTIQVGGSSTREATIENTGGANLEITDVAIAGADESDFSVQSGGGPGTLVPGATRTVTIAFAPASAGTKSATLSVSSNAGSSSVNLNGAAFGEPAATTNPASDVSSEGATLNGTVDPNGASTNVTFEYREVGEQDVQTVTATQSPLTGDGSTSVSATITGLTPATEYAFRVAAENEAGSDTGEEQTFTTGASIPQVITDPSTEVAGRSATLNGRVNPNGGETAVRFEWGLTPEYGNETTAQESPLAASTSEQAVSAGLSDLQPGTTYHYRVVAENAAGSAAGDDQTFTTLAPVLSISPSALSFRQAGVGDTTATQSVEIENTGNADLAISSISLSSTAHFVISDDAEASTLAPGGTRTIGVALAPASSGVHEATLDVESNAGAGSVTLEGTGIAVNVLPPARAISVTGEPQEITVTTTEGFQAQTGFLYHRRGGALTYDRVPLTAENATTFTASIPGTAITERGIDVYAEFIDGDLTATFPAMNPRETPLHLRTQTSSLPAVGRFEPEVYRMVTVPALPSDTDPAAVLNEYGEYEPQQWRLLRWDPQAGQAGSYRELEASQEFPALESSFTPGTAFWLVTREGTSFSVDDATSTDASGPFTLRLQPGYNQVANPFSFPVSWSAVEAPSGVDEPREALPPYGTVTVLEPWEGYWVFNRNATPVQVAIPPRESEATALTTEKQSKAPETLFEDRPPYALQLTAQLSTGASEGVLYDRHNYVGWTDEAASGFGAEDVPEVPPVGPHVRLSIAVNNMRLAGSLHPAGQRGYAWDLEVAAAVPEPFFRRKTVTVQLHHHGALPSDYELRLIDHDHDQTQLIKEDRFSVALTSAHPARRFRLVLGTPEFAEKETAAVVPRATALGAGYPNPAQSAVSFDYQLSDDQRVVIAVYDVLGRRVQTLIDREQAAGSHSVRWDGHQASGTPVASGVYVVRMQAGAFSGTRRVVIVR